MLTYRGYKANFIVDLESGILHGCVLEIQDVITFEGTTVQQIEDEFRKSVDVYLAFCQELNEAPNQP